MLGGKTRRCALAMSLALAGCFNFGGPPVGREAPKSAAPAPTAAIPRTAPELRIPASAVAAASPEIPVVPVPPPPLGGDRKPAIQPVSAQGRALTQVPSPPPPPPPAAAAPVTPPATAPSPGAAATSPGATPTVRQLVQQAAERYAGIDSYIARLTRREVVGSKSQPEEVLLFKFRKEPWSVYFKWLGTTGQGREVVYVKDQYENKLHTLLAAGDHPLMGAGKRMSLPIDSIFVRNASRHPITEAGIGASVERLGRLLDSIEHGDKRVGTLTVLGAQSRPEFSKPAWVVEHVLPPGQDPSLPRGGRRLYGFDPDSKLPLLVTAVDDRGQEVEYYSYDRLQYPVKLDNDDFNPDKLWAKPAAAPARGTAAH
jgi:Protein of unknown function (DUF1571)